MWYYEGKEVTEIPEGFIGFVYLIENLNNNKKYIGKKNFYFSKTKQVKGKKKRIKVESDWKDYFGSNDLLQEDAKNANYENIRRDIVRLCKSKGEMSYIECKLQFQNNVLESDEWYNSWVQCKVHKKHLTFLKK